MKNFFFLTLSEAPGRIIIKVEIFTRCILLAHCSLILTGIRFDFLQKESCQINREYVYIVLPYIKNI